MPAFVHQAEGANSGVSTLGCTFSSVAAGNVIAVMVVWADATITLDSITDGQGNAYSLLDNPTTHGSATGRAAHGWALIASTGGLTVTAHFSGTVASGVNIIAHEVSGVHATAPVDGHLITTQSSPGTGTNGVASANIVTAIANDYVFGWTWDIGNNASSIAAGTNYALRDTVLANKATEDRVLASPGTVNATFTYTGGGADQIFVGILALRPPSTAVVATTTSNRIGIFSKDGVLSCGTFDVGIPIAYGLFDDDYVAQFDGVTLCVTASGTVGASVPLGAFDRDVQVSPLGLFGAN